MDLDFDLTRENLVALCDAAIDSDIDGESVSAIAFAILASDRFIWEDDVISEVLNDWSCPEINFPLAPPTYQMHRRWLKGEEIPPVRPPLPRDRARGRVVSIRRKVWLSSPVPKCKGPGAPDV